MIEFKCSHCDHQIKAKLAAAGVRSKCPNCKANITVPMPEHSDPIRHEPLLEPDEFIEPDVAVPKPVRRQQDYRNPNVFRNPVNGYQVDVSLAWLWVLLFGAIYFAVKGVWTHFIGGLLLGMVTLGLAWLVYPFYACRIMRNHYLSMGWSEDGSTGSAGGQSASRPVPQLGPKKWLKPALIAFACVFGFCLVSSIIGSFISDGGTYSDLAALEESNEKAKKLNEEMRQVTNRRFNREMDAIMSGEGTGTSKGGKVKSDPVQMNNPFAIGDIRYTVHSAGYLKDIGNGIFKDRITNNQNLMIVDISAANVGGDGSHVRPPKLKDENDYEYEMDAESLLLKNCFDVGSLSPGIRRRGLLAFSVPAGRNYRVVLYGNIGLNTETREVPLNLP